MSRLLKIVFMGAFFVALVTAIVWISANRPRVMVLQSYAPDYVWTREIDVGLDRILSSKSWIDIRYHYMESKKHSSADYLRRTGISVRKVIESIEPDVLIAVDDNAQKYAAKHFVDHPRIKIVFAGINGSIDPYGYDKANNVTGILERKPVRALVEMISAISKSTGLAHQPRAVFLSDLSHSTERDGHYLETQDWAPVSYGGRVAFDTFEAWQAYVLSAADKTDFLLVGGYRKLYRDQAEKDREGDRKTYVSSSEVARWTEEHSPVPVIGMNVFNTEDGVMASVGVSPYEQGETAASMALDLIDGEKGIADVAIRTSQHYVIALRRSALEKRNIQLPQVFEAYARSTNNFIP